jgi:hypothetical protein
MIGAKPIEEGCKAMILAGIGSGMRVDVGRFIGVWGGGSDYWEVKPDGWVGSQWCCTSMQG